MFALLPLECKLQLQCFLENNWLLLKVVASVLLLCLLPQAFELKRLRGTEQKLPAEIYLLIVPTWRELGLCSSIYLEPSWYRILYIRRLGEELCDCSFGADEGGEKKEVGECNKMRASRASLWDWNREVNSGRECSFGTFCCCYVASVVSDSVRPHRWQPTRLPHPWDSPGKNTGVGCHFLLQCMKVKSESEVTQSCLTFSDPRNCSPPGSFFHGIFQARVLEWGAIAFSTVF